MIDFDPLTIAAFDTETCGVDPTTTRIVTAAFVEPKLDATTWILDPGIEIPDQAAQIHGITTAQAQADGMTYEDGYRDIRHHLEQHWAAGGTLAVYNASYDLTLMHHEGLRLGYPPLTVGPTIDPFVIDRALDPYRKGSRKLVDVHAHHFPQHPTSGAHDAEWDTRAAGRLAWFLTQRAELADYDVDALMTAQAAWHHDRQESYRSWLLGQGRAADAAQVSSEWPIQSSRRAVA